MLADRVATAAVVDGALEPWSLVGWLNRQLGRSSVPVEWLSAMRFARQRETDWS